MAVDAKKVAEKYESDGEDGLNEEEKRFLQDRGVKLEEPVPVVFKSPNGGVVSNDPVALLNNMTEQRHTDLEAEIERRVELELARRAGEVIQANQHQEIVGQTPHTGTANANVHPSSSPINPEPDGVDEEDEAGEEDYDEGWNNDDRRAELATRGLSTAGGKDVLIARLLRSDNEETTEEDKAS